MRGWSKEKTKQMKAVNLWCGYYRSNPHRFAEDYLGVRLKIFQCILLVMMNVSNKFAYIASRGQGKSLLTAIFCCVRCILYPNTQICISAGSKEQSAEIIGKIILNIMPKSPLLRNEIADYKNNTSGAYIIFKCGSYIKTVTASDNGRHNRANILIIDEYRMVKKNIVDTVLTKFLTSSREAGYLNKPEYAHLKERNKQIYLSSAFFKKHWAWGLVKSYAASMLDDKRSYFICGLPYQLSIKEGIIMREDIEDEMKEASFNAVSFRMENECLWHGEAEDAFFNYDELVFARKIPNAFYLSSTVDYVGLSGIKPPIKKNGEIRLLAADIAVMGSKRRRNDATSLTVLQLIPTNNNQYIRNVVYLDNFEGGHSETQAIKIRKVYEDFQCDYIIIDTQGRNAHRNGNIVIVVRKKSGMLRCKSEWKAIFKMYSHTQRIGDEPLSENIIRPRVRAIYVLNEK